MRLTKLLLTAAIGFTLVACSDKDTALQDSLNADSTADTISNLDYGSSIIPFPNDLLFAPTPGGPAPDGTLNIPVDDATDLSDPKVAMNGLDGFSTISPFSTGFTGAIDSRTISATSVRVYVVTKGAGPGGPVTAAGNALTYGEDYVAQVSSLDTSNSSLVIVPLKPLAAKTSYAVVITRELKSRSGLPMGISGSYLLTRGAAAIYDVTVTPSLLASSATDMRAAINVGSLQPAADATEAEVESAALSAFKLESIRAGIVNPSEEILVAADATLNSADIILHWSFTTQSIADVLQQTRTITNATNPTLTFNPTPVALPDSVPIEAAAIYVGSLTVPYYLTAASSIDDPTPLGSYWQGVGGSFLTSLGANPGCLPAGTNVCPVSTSIETIPVMLSVPVDGCNGPCPVVIYQHGITTNRSTLLAIADSMASAGFAVIAIDMPMHGITGNETNGTALFKDTVNGERTFDLDLVTQDAATGEITATIADGITDTSGRHFINLANLQNSRDNVRQAVSDLFALTAALPGADFNGASANGGFSTTVKFLGHSLGGIVGITFLALEPNVGDAVLAMSGGGIAKLLDGSAAFGPSIASGLAALGVNKGSAEFEAFMGATQTVVDSGDPINFATPTINAATGRGILFFEVVGGNGVPSDQVVPNRVPDVNDISNTVPGPLSGTDPIVGADADIANPGLGLTQYNANEAGPDLMALVRFNAGDHGSILSPDASLAVTREMQTQAATFFATGSLSVNDVSVIVAP